MVESLPEKRTGSAWQQQRSVRSWVRTARQVDPLRRFNWSRVRADGRMCWTLLIANCASAGFLPIVAVLLVGMATGSLMLGDPGFAMLAVGVGITVGVVFLALTGIEALGIRFYARRHGWRDAPGVRLAILAHASYAWILCSFSTLAGFLVGMHFTRIPQYALGLWVFGGFLLGLVVFETHVYFGMRRMRFANAPGSERELADGQENPSPVGADADILSPKGRGTGEDSE